MNEEEVESEAEVEVEREMETEQEGEFVMAESDEVIILRLGNLIFIHFPRFRRAIVEMWNLLTLTATLRLLMIPT